MNMNFYVDFEATQPEQEIISIGAVADNGATFYALVKPQFSSVSKYISDMTGITQEMLNEANSLNVVLGDFSAWCYNQEKLLTSWRFYSYGDGDVEFLKHSLCNVIGEQQTIVAALMIAKMQDYSKKVTKYFRGTTSLIKAFNFLKELEKKQKHNALEDARMLAEVFSKVEYNEPLAMNPFITTIYESKTEYKFPSGRFFCKATGKNAKEREFPCVEAAIEWLIETNISKDARENVHRDRIATKIMKAIRKHSTYMGYKWRRDKNTKIAFIDKNSELTINDTVYYGTEIEAGHWIIPNENGNYIYVKPNEDYSDVKLINLDSNKVNINGTNYDLVWKREKI